LGKWIWQSELFKRRFGANFGHIFSFFQRGHYIIR
jgi:hypothetical protein